MIKILVVDDEELVRWFLQRAIGKLGCCEVITASNSREAIEKLTSQHIDILFTDLRMPGENGAILVEKVRDFTHPPKIVVCSAFITPEMAKDFNEKGVYCLKKPFKLDELENILNKCINQ